MCHNDKSNPFRYYDPRSLVFYKNLKVPDGIIIPTTDEGAWEHFKEFRDIYNKINVAMSQNIACAPMGIVPENFPVFMKPILNLHGMGLGSKILSSLEDYENEKHLSGYFWMEYLQGEHLSHDFIVSNGKIVFCITFKGYPFDQGMFDYWETTEIPKNLFHYIDSWLQKNLSKYSGCVNIETIGNKIIECHLRMGDIDRLGSLELMQNIINVYYGQKWKFNTKIPKFYLFILWGKQNFKYSIDRNIADGICKQLTCYDLDDPKLAHQNPPGGARIAVLCSYNKQDCIKARYKLYENFEPKPKKPILDYTDKKQELN